MHHRPRPRPLKQTSASSTAAERGAHVSSVPTLNLAHLGDEGTRAAVWQLEHLWPGSRVVLLVDDRGPGYFYTAFPHIVSAIASRALVVEIHGEPDAAAQWERHLRRHIEAHEQAQGALW